MTAVPGMLVGSAYVCTRYGSRSHLCVSDKKNKRLAFCGLSFHRNSKAWNEWEWSVLSTSSRVTCRSCLDILSGRTYYRTEEG